MNAERFKQIFKEKVSHLTNEQINEQIALDRQMIQSLIEVILKNVLTSKG